MKKARQNEWLFCARENYVDIGMAVRCDNSWHQRKKEGMEKNGIYLFVREVLSQQLVHSIKHFELKSTNETRDLYATKLYV